MNKFRKPFASMLMMTVLFAQSFAFAGIPQITFAEEESVEEVVVEETTVAEEEDEVVEEVESTETEEESTEEEPAQEEVVEEVVASTEEDAGTEEESESNTEALSEEEEQNSDESKEEDAASEEDGGNTTSEEKTEEDTEGDSDFAPAAQSVAYNQTFAVENDSHNMCLDTLTPEGNDGPVTIKESFGEDEKTLVEILANNGITVSEVADQKSFETWVSHTHDVTFEVELLGKEAAYAHTFGYYEAGTGDSTYTPVFRNGTMGSMGAPVLGLPLFSNGDKALIEIPKDKKIGFAIDVYTEQQFAGFYASENLLNADNQADHVVVYEIEDGYALAFEDLPSNALTDEDYNDIVVAVRAIACEVPTGGTQYADLRITKDASVATSTTNQTFNYSISVTNGGPDTATGVVVTDVLPTGLVYESSSATKGSYASTTGTWTVGEIANGNTETLTLGVKVTATTSGNLVNTATVTNTGDQVDNDSENDIATSTVEVKIKPKDTTTDVTVVASKIVCDDPSEMPQWGNNGPHITSTTAIDYVAEHDSCRLVPDWDFQWGFGYSNVNGAGVTDPGKSFYGKTATGTAHNKWKDFPTATDANGVTEVNISFEKGTETKIWVREALKDGYVDFAGVVTETDEVSAEMYCHTDVLHYDNYDWVSPISDNATYYCVAFNTPEDTGGDQCKISDENLIENGSFETPLITHEDHWNIFDSGTQGWYATWITNVDSHRGLAKPNPAHIEIQENGLLGGTAYKGTQYAELDTDWDGPDGTVNREPALIEMYQDIDTYVGATYTLSYAYAGRPNTPAGANDNKMDVKIDGVTKKTHSVSTTTVGTLTWYVESIEFVATDTDTRISFVGKGTQNSFGMLVDDVSVVIKSCEPVDPTGIDLSVNKTASVATTTVGTSFSYSIAVTNNGPETATGVEVTDMLPAGIDFVSSSATKGSYATTTGIWTIGTIAASSTETLTINVVASSTGDISNTATATGTETDTNSGNDSSTVVVNVEDDNNGGGGDPTGIDLSVNKTASVSTTTVGATFSYTISLTNNGPENASGVNLEDILPVGVTLVDATTTVGTYATTTGIWSVGDLASSTTEILTITVTASSTGDVVNTATASSTDGKTDNDTDNNTDSVTVTIEDDNNGGGGDPTGIDLSVSKTGSISEVSATEVEFTYNITVTNNGPEDATDIEVTDVLPASVTFVSATTTAGTYDANTSLWTIASLAKNGSATLTMVVKVISIDSDIVNTATATSTSGKTDNDPSNNSGSHTVIINTGSGGGGGGNGGSGGGSGGSGGGTINFVGVGGGNAAPQCEYLKEFMRLGDNNNPVEVIKLQAFLNAFEGEGLAVDGFFDINTDAAVRRFQLKYFGDVLDPWGHIDSTGYVYILTKKKVNEIFCQRAFPVTEAEANEIVAFRAFLTALRSQGVPTDGFSGGIGGTIEDGTEVDLEIPGEDEGGIGNFFRNLFGGSEDDTNEDGDTENEGAATTTSSLDETSENGGVASAINSLAAAALVFPGNLGDAIGCLIVLLIVLVIIYALGTLIVNSMSEGKTVEEIRQRKLISFMAGIIIAIIIALLVPYPCIIVPLILILIVLAIWTIIRGKGGNEGGDAPQEMNREFVLTPDQKSEEKTN